MARATNVDGFLPDDGSVHDKVWSQTRKAARRFFRDTLHPMRNKWDYDVAPLADESALDDLHIIQNEAPGAFVALFADARDAVARQHRFCTMPTSLCDRCRGQPAPACTREAALSEVADLERRVDDYLTRRIPTALAADTQGGGEQQRAAP